MNKAFGNDDPRLSAYIGAVYAPEDAVLAEIRTRSIAAGLPDIQVAALDGRHLELLTRLLGARRAVEIGTLGGYSGVCILRGMAEGGQLHSLELAPHHAEVARESFRRAGFATRARVHVGAALEVLPGLAAEGPFDLVFIDADKKSTPEYFEWALELTRPGSVIVTDNVIRDGALIDTGNQDPTVLGGRRFHELLAADRLGDARVSATTIQTVGSKGYDGFTLALVLPA